MIDNCLVAMTHDESSPQDVSRNFAIPAASDNLIAPCIWFQHYDKNNSKKVDYLQLSFILGACKQTKLYPSNVTGLSPSGNDMPPLRFLLTKGRLKPLHIKSQTLLGNSRVGSFDAKRLRCLCSSAYRRQRHFSVPFFRIRTESFKQEVWNCISKDAQSCSFRLNLLVTRVDIAWL